MMEWPHKEISVAIPLGQFLMEESYVRSWRERLFTRPWQPLQKIGMRPTLMARLLAAKERNHKEIERITGVPQEYF